MRKRIYGSLGRTEPLDHVIQKLPVGSEGIERWRRAGRRAAKRLVSDDPPAGTKQRGDPLHRLRRVALVHQEKPGVREVECASQRLRIDVVDITDTNLDVVESERRGDRSSALHRGLAEVDPYNLPLWPDHLGHDGERTKGSTSAIDHPPPWLHADLAKRRTGRLGTQLGDAQQTLKVLVAAVEDITPDPLANRLAHGACTAQSYQPLPNMTILAVRGAGSRRAARRGRCPPSPDARRTAARPRRPPRPGRRAARRPPAGRAARRRSRRRRAGASRGARCATTPSARCARRARPGQRRHAEPGGDERLHDAPCRRTCSRCAARSPRSSHSASRWPRQRSQPAIHVASRRLAEPARAAGRQQVHRVVEQVVQADAGRLGLGLVVAEDDRHLDLARPQQLERLGRMGVRQADLQAGMLARRARPRRAGPASRSRRRSRPDARARRSGRRGRTAPRRRRRCGR